MNSFFKHTYYNTYYYANIVDNVLNNDPELAGFVSDFFEERGFINQLTKPFQKRSAFHVFIEHVLCNFLEDDMHCHDQRNYEYCKLNRDLKFKPYVDSVLEEYGIKNYSLMLDVKNYADIERHHEELVESGILEVLYEVIANEIFHIMFNNREVLLRFNLLIAQKIHDNNNDKGESAKYFNKNGFLKRVGIPAWCKKAVYFRDRGRCCFCLKNLNGILSIHNQKHYDHIIPLAQGGLNDVANIQLLCLSCNLNKGKRHIRTSEMYERWY
ncbi:HNH endonuclease signature motif containing protein [Danxiaibacter flavus]|uniref:HNH endonuclease signature motif containing protein n=1 Tax=Danxiaibacter flavus TaxID=3049108 RepID=A0ABV3ZNA6_9BACT|nr:HNH endonuclease signature motif containing protein [Chitinophagaceae bacterium DXS]